MVPAKVETMPYQVSSTLLMAVRSVCTPVVGVALPAVEIGVRVGDRDARPVARRARGDGDGAATAAAAPKPVGVPIAARAPVAMTVVVSPPPAVKDFSTPLTKTE
jgi:hypothetical protein